MPPLIFKHEKMGLVRVLAAMSVLIASVSACGKSDGSVHAAVHAVNYSASELTYRIQDPHDSDNVAGGESIGPFSAGGTVCCYTLPRIWTSGMAIQIVASRLDPVHVRENAPGLHSSVLVEVPQYSSGKTGDLWLIVAPDGKMSLVLSHVQPDHPDWPGQPKGWPIPSDEYRTGVNFIRLQRARGDVALFQTFLKELESDPGKHAAEAWEDAMKYEPEMKNKFLGADDPKFRERIRTEYMEGLQRAKGRLRDLEGQ